MQTRRPRLLAVALLVVGDAGTVIIQIGEYEPGAARVTGNLGPISYQFVK